MPGFLYILLIVTSLIMIGIGLPMALGKVPQNNWYGFRFPVTMRSQEAWDTANRQYGWWLVLAGVLSLPIPIVWWCAGWGVDLVWIYVVMMAGPTLLGILPSLRSAYRAEAQAKADKADNDQDAVPEHFRS